MGAQPLTRQIEERGRAEVGAHNSDSFKILKKYTPTRGWGMEGGEGMGGRSGGHVGQFWLTIAKARDWQGSVTW